jgi:signal transduction histidine kinase
MFPGSSIEASIHERILLLSPTDARAASLATVLQATEVSVEQFTTLSPLAEELRNGAGAIIADEDAITEEAVRLLSTAMAQREPWSNLPIIILTTGEPAAIERLDQLDLFGPATSSNVTILERPVHEVTLATVVRSALRARRRQYEVRDLMQNLKTTNEQLRQSQEALQEANETLEERVAARTEQVRELALALTTAEQRERARISQVLHDHLQQLIHGARIWVDSLAEEAEGDPPLAVERLLDLLDEAIETTRSLSVELSPPVLQDEGLPAALDWLASHVSKTHNFDLNLDVPPEMRVSEEDLRTLLFRSVRELVFNVVKHAAVDRALLRVRCAEDRLAIEVRDEGVGFDPASLNEEEDSDDHFGLFSVRERMDLVGGQLTIDSAPGEGTCARIEVPLSEESEA